MAKALRIIGVIVAVVAIAATAVATFGASIGISAGVVGAAGTVATVAGIAAGVIGVASQFAKPPGFSGGGNPQSFVTNPQSGLPYAAGRTRMSGIRIHGETNRSAGYTKADDLLWFAVLLSAGGAIDAIETFKADNVAISFNGSGNAIAPYANYMALRTSLGGSTALSLSLNGTAAAGWSSAHKLTGMAHALWGLRFDTNGKFYTAGVPEPQWIGRWVKVYDPRKDSTYPGGSGSHRALVESTYEWSRNPALHGLTWALGRWQNGKRTLGIGAPIANIRVAEFVEAANIADANGWHCGGVSWSTDSKWDVLKRFLQAGGAVPTMTGAMIGCLVNAPRVSITTISSNHVLDDLSIAVTKSRRDRFNTVIPRYRSEAHEWEVISGTPIVNAAYAAADGQPRTKEIDFPMVQSESGQAGVDGEKQAGQLSAYEIVNSREAGPISFTTGPEFIGLKSGDCVTLNVPEEGLVSQQVILKSVSLDPATAKISFVAETETPAKHAFALGQTTTPPPPFSLTPGSLTPDRPSAAIWSAAASRTTDGIPSIIVTGANEYTNGTDVVIRYKQSVSPEWMAPVILPEPTGSTQYVINLLDPATLHDVEVAYRNGSAQGEWRALGPIGTLNNQLSTSIISAGQTATWENVRNSDPNAPEDNATYGATPKEAGDIRRAIAPNPNIFPLPRPILDGRTAAAQGWQNVGNVNLGTSPFLGGGFYQIIRAGGGAALTEYPFIDIPTLPYVKMAFSLNGYAGGTGATFSPYVEELNGAGGIVGNSPMTLNNETGRWEVVRTFTAAAAFARLVCRCDFQSSSSYQDLVWWAIKAEYGNAVTPIAEDQRLIGGDRVSWDNGLSMNALRPAELGANVTGNHPALDVINSGPWLRTTAITPGDVVGRTQNLNIGGMFSSLANIVQRRISQLRRNDDFTDVTEADVFTSQGVALDIFGSGDLARRNFASLPFGNNMAVNSDFSSGLTGWASTASNFGLNLAGFSGSRNVFYATQSNLSSGASADVFFSDTVWEGRPLANSARFGIPCVQNDRVFVRALLARHRCDSVLYLLVFNSAGVLVQADEIAGGRNYGGAGGDPANFDDVSGVFTVMHPQSSFAILMVRQLGTGEADPYIFVAEPMIGKLAPGQSAIPAYTPGRTDPMADVTSQNVAFDIQGATAWTRYNGIQPFQVNGRLSRIFDNGRVSSPRGFYNSQMILGPSNVTNLQPSYVQNANNVTVMLPAHTRTVTDAGPVALSYGGVSGTVAFSTYWAAFVDDPEMTGLASPIAGFTSNPEDLMYPGRYHIASGYSPDASGRGGSTGTGGGGPPPAGGSVEFPLP